MSSNLRLCLVLHNHQPIGNFDEVIEQAYYDSYLPFLDVFESYSQICISLHTSGPLLRWIEQRFPEYVRRVATLVAAGRIEILGGPFYEPILPILPSRDRIGQICAYSEYLNSLFGTQIRGMWMPERVWETALVSDIAKASIQYTVLDDFHFKAAGLSEQDLTGCFITEHDGSNLKVFPGSERLRYLIPFADVEQTIEYCRQVAQRDPNATLVFGDDGEKFGTWPDTKDHVYQRGWLRRFFDALEANSTWLKTATLSTVAKDQAPRGKVYLPDCSYREMTEWALPVTQHELYQELSTELSKHPRWDEISQFMRGGNWRNFLVRYAESNEMYARMMEISRALEDARRRSGDAELLSEVEDNLYRGQCNCAYWHGAFGGIYLPHLRNAIYSELIAADNQLEYLEHGKASFVEARSEDYNFDLRPEVKLANEQFVAYFAPAAGGMMYELDVRATRQNLLATMQRRPEAYHQKILNATAHQATDHVKSIHDQVVLKQAGLENLIQYDAYPRKSFLEHFFDNDVAAASVADGSAMERGDFVAQRFDAKLRRAASKIQLQLSRDGNAWGIPFRLTKAVTVEAGSPLLDIVYLLEGLPRDRELHLAVEWNFAGLPAGADDRYFYDARGTRLGHLGTRMNLSATQHLGMIDQWQGVDILVGLSRPSGLWTFPVESVSQSEAGYELVHQSVCVMPHWLVRGDHEGKWSVQMQIRIAQSKQPCVIAEQVTQDFVMATSQAT
ncbi:MAG: DUF1926 domain-containing protein [Planctomycetales bacterium]|nr:DUF1926 domain-containing protein [Planctomycetales bacterium]